MDTRQQEIGERLRVAREARGLSKRRAAHMAGVSESRWRQVESGVQYKDGVAHPASTTPETLVRMARAVGVNAGELLEDAGFAPDIAEHITDTPRRGRSELPPAPGSRIINLDQFNEREQELIATFISGLELGRKIS